jgi:two-component system, LytTR family, sensor kinase
MFAKPFFRNIHFILWVTAIVTDLMLYFVFVYVNANTFIPVGLTLREFWRENWLILLQFLAITYFVYYTINFFNKTAKPNAASRFVKELLFIIVAGFLLQEVFRTIFINFIVAPEDSKTLTAKLRMLQMVNVTAVVVQYTLMTSVRIYRYLQQKQLEVIRLQKEYTQTQFEALKNQLNPHFLFNSLSVLSSLVYVDANLAETFIEKLSKTYRYLLEQRDKEKVNVKNEMDFVHAYSFLLNQRFGKKLELEIGEVNNNGSLIPHSLLIAMEYIVSNNAMSASKPLHITVAGDDDGIMIQYNENPKSTIEKNSVEQLRHLQEKYTAINEQFKVIPQTYDEFAAMKFYFI